MCDRTRLTYSEVMSMFDEAHGDALDELEYELDQLSGQADPLYTEGLAIFDLLGEVADDPEADQPNDSPRK